MAVFPTIPSGQMSGLMTPSVSAPQQNRQKKLLLLLAVLLVATVIVIYFGLFSKDESPELAITTEGIATNNALPISPGQTAAVQEEFSYLETAKLDFSFFDSDKFQSLKEYVSDLDISGEKGRPNPYVPY